MHSRLRTLYRSFANAAGSRSKAKSKPVPLCNPGASGLRSFWERTPADRAALGGLLSLIFNYEAAAVLQQAANQDVLARSGARDVIRELANRILEGGDIDSDRFKEIVEGIKAAVPYRSREMFHPIRLALTGQAGDGALDRVILLLDPATKLDFALPVKGTRQRVLEFCAGLD